MFTSHIMLQIVTFQSTRPARGATGSPPGTALASHSFNPRAPRGARPWIAVKVLPLLCFNPRAPRGARLRDRHVCRLDVRVSIHAPREGRDFNSQMLILLHLRFNPRAPRGARRYLAPAHTTEYRFQSTRPARGATRTQPLPLWSGAVSIHAPREGRDRSAGARREFIDRFQSTRPARGATFRPPFTGQRVTRFQSTRPARGATLTFTTACRCSHVSIHAPREGRDCTVAS